MVTYYEYTYIDTKFLVSMRVCVWRSDEALFINAHKYTTQ